MTEKKYTICPLDCPDSCAMIATVENDTITKLEGDPHHEFTAGFLCQKMRSYHNRVHSKDRILYPMKRTGKKGDAQFERINWDEACEIMVEQLKSIKEKHGAESVLPYSYAGNMGVISRTAGAAFFNRYGASKLGETICSSAAKAGWNAHMGNRPGSDPIKAADSDLIIAWGINVKVSNIHFWPQINKCRKKGGKLVVIDPYKNKTAKAADEYVQVKPAGDAALALGLAKVILEKQGENRDYIVASTTGFNEFEQSVEALSWKDIEEQSGIGKSDITKLADLLLANPKSFIRIGVGLSRNTVGAMSIRAISALAAILGLHSGETGKGVLLSAGSFNGDNETLKFSHLKENPVRQVNMIQLGHALTALKPGIHGLFVFNSNPLSVAPDASRVKKGLEREDLFTVVHEQVMTPTARYADLLLPATTALENQDIFGAYGHFSFGISERVINPIGEAKDNFSLFQLLAEKMGYEDTPFKQSLEERIQSYLAALEGVPEGTELSDFKPGQYIKSVKAENSFIEQCGKITFVSSAVPSNQPQLPGILRTGEFDNPDLLSRFALKLLTPPNGKLLNSTFGDRLTDDTGYLMIHPVDAQERGISDGDSVMITNDRGEAIRSAAVTEDTQQGVVVAEGIYWERFDLKTGSINNLTSQKTTDLGEGGTFHESLVEVMKIS